MNLNIRGVDVAISDQAIAEVLRERLSGAAQPHAVRISTIPAIGSAWPGQEGVYTGMARGLEGKPDYPLIVGPEAPGKLDWKAAHAFAAEHPGWRLMHRHEAWLCKANVPQLFKDDWYWTGTQREANDGCAWGQYFGDGYQFHFHKVNELFVRLVRSVSVID